MDFKRVITEFLGLQDVNIEDIKQYKKSLKAEIYVRHLEHKACCHKCRNPLKNIREWHIKKLKGPPLGIYTEVVIKFRQARGECESCGGKRMAYAPFIHPEHPSMSCGFAEVAGRLMEELTCEASARLLKADSMTLWRLDQDRMMHMLAYMELPKTLDISHLCADEVHFKTVRNKQRKSLFSKRYDMKYITNLVCWKESKVLFNDMGRDSKALKGCLDVLTPEQKELVEFFAVDIHDPFISVIKKECPNAEICLDRFHVAKKLNEKFDSVRKSEFKKARQEAKAKNKKSDFMSNMLSPHRRFILVSRNKDLLKSEVKMLEKLRQKNENIQNAMLLVEHFHTVMDSKKVSSFRRRLTEWYYLVRESKLKPFKALAKTIRQYRQYIENYIKSGLTTGVSEGINTKIKAIKRAGNGYHDQDSFRLKILQRCGYLNSQFIDTRSFYKEVTMPTT